MNKQDNCFEISISGNVKGTLKIVYEDNGNDTIITINDESKSRKYGKNRNSESKVENSEPTLSNNHTCDNSCEEIVKNTITAPIQFEDPNNLLQKEKKSKRLSNESALVHYLSSIRKKILEKFPGTKGNDRPWHIELCSRFMGEDVMVQKAKSLQGREINVRDVENYEFIGKDDRAFTLKTGQVEDYGETHITIAFFLKPLTEDEKKWVQSLIV